MNKHEILLRSGILSVIVGFVLLFANQALNFWAGFSTVNFMVDGENVQRQVDGNMYVIPVLLLLAGAVSIGYSLLPTSKAPVNQADDLV